MVRGWLSVAVLLAVVIQSQTADKYTDQNRPYEFGFRIGEEQHRHEKKDENGIIMGEFGFLTADGVYHVTVYATDENGNFKIVSMKNIRVHPYPGTTSEKKGHSLPFPPSENPPQTQRPPAPKVAEPVPQVPAKTCSHCRLAPPTTAKPLLTDIAVVSRDQNNQLDTYNPQQEPSRPQVPPNTDFSQNNPPPGQFNSGFQEAHNGVIPSPGQTLQAPFSNPAVERNPKRISNSALQQGLGPKIDNNLEQPQPESAQSPIKPTLLSAQMQIVDKNTDVYNKKPGEKEGLPAGLTKDDMLQLLYTFNYTVGFHGHFEEGYTNGAKQGYYYITGRNGVRTRVDYVADEKGFRPKITQEVLDILSDDVPKPETEKDEKFGLKGYEFKWLYFPVGSNKR